MKGKVFGGIKGASIDVQGIEQKKPIVWPTRFLPAALDICLLLIPLGGRLTAP